MCGIVGYLRLRDRSGFDVAPAVAIARDRMAHRGPDAAGLYASPDGRCALAAQRLAIRDLSPAGGQPLSNEDGSVWAVFNGEIYNADSLRERLARSGHRFRSRCDAEVLVHLYEEMRADLVDEIDGEFAFFIYDSRTSELIGARDRVGVKPLFIAHSAERFAFASEPKGLLALPDVSRAPRLEEITSYLAFGCVPGPPTLHRDIERVEPGTRIRISSDGNLRAERFWNFPASASGLLDPAECEAALGAALKQAIDKRMIADVPVGAALSGGIDSGLVVAEMSRSARSPTPTFTIAYPGDGADPRSDAFHARILAREFATDHEELILDRHAFSELMDDVAALADDPNGSPSAVALLHLAKAARARGVRVLQVGEGADEAFCGYAAAHRIGKASRSLSVARRLMPPDRLDWLLRRFGEPFERALERMQPLGVVTSNAIEPLRRCARGEPAYWGHGLVFSSRYWRVLCSELADFAQPRDRLVARIARDREFARRPELDRIALIDLLVQLPERLLMRADRAAMRYGVEVRVPFVDPAVLEVALRIPPALRAATQKGFLRAYARGRLPAAIAERKKSGFPTARAVFLAPEVVQRIRSHLLDPAFLDLTGFRRATLCDLIAAGERQRPRSLAPLWPLYVLALWARHWT